MNRDFKNLEEDIRNHVEEEVAENVARGMAPKEARYAALKKFGNLLRVQEDSRAIWLPIWLEQLFQDCRYALRTYRRNKLFSAAVVLTIALGIGLNTAMFSVVNTVLLRPLPFPDPERLVAYYDGISAVKAEPFKSGIIGADFAEWHARAKSFQYLAGYQYQDTTLATATEANRVRSIVTTGDFWPLTGVKLALGRFLTASESAEGVILSHRAFQRQFGGDARVIGMTVVLGGRTRIITGVLPADFRFLFPQDRSGSDWPEPDAYVPSPPLLRGDRSRVFIVGKLNADATAPAALSELKGIQQTNLASYPDRWFAGVDRMLLLPLRERLAGSAGQAILILQAAGFFVLLIACANIANLLLARTSARQREISIRVALGAGKERVIRQFFAEGLLLAVFGALAGLILASVLVRSFSVLGPAVNPRMSEVAIDVRVLAFTIAVTLLSALLFCVGPVAALWRKDSQSAVTNRGGPANGGPVRLNAHRLLVAAELAMAVVLLAGAGLMAKSFLILHADIPGFEPARTLILRMSFTKQPYKERGPLISKLDQILTGIESLPGVQFAGIAEKQSYLLQTASGRPAIVDRFDEFLVSPGYFPAVGMRLIAGRWLVPGDAADAAVINETLARRAFGALDPIGREIAKLGRAVRVVGVVANLKYQNLDVEPGPELFRGYAQNIAGLPAISIVARVVGDPSAIAAAARSRIRAIEPQESIYGIQTLADTLSDSIAPRRFNFVLLVSFAAIALLMAIVGIYGVVSYSVTQRTREIGVRLALGAPPWSVTSMLIKQGMGFCFAGILAGLAGAHGLTRWIAGMLYAVEPNDPSVMASVTALFLTVAFLACAIPASRATRTDPLLSLRHD